RSRRQTLAVSRKPELEPDLGGSSEGDGFEGVRLIVISDVKRLNHMKKLLFLALPLCILVFSCNNTDSPEPPKPQPSNGGIEGEWKYEQFTIIAYDSTGKKHSIRTETDPDEGIFLRFNQQGSVEEGDKHDGEVDATGTYLRKNK